MGLVVVYGNLFKNGVEVVIEVINVRGDVEIFVLSFCVEDSGSMFEGVKVVFEVVFSIFLVVIGGVISDLVFVVVEVVDLVDKVLFLLMVLSFDFKWVFCNFFLFFLSVQEEVVIMGCFFVDIFGWNFVGVFLEDSVFGVVVVVVFEEVFVGEFVGVCMFIVDDVVVMVVEFKEVGVQGVYVGVQGDQLIVVVQVVKVVGFEVYVIFVLVSFDVIIVVGVGVENVFFMEIEFDVDSEDFQIVEFVVVYEVKFSSKLDFYVVYGFDLVFVMVEVYKEMGGVFILSDFVKGMCVFFNFLGVIGNIQFCEDGLVQKFNCVYFIVNGEVVDYQFWCKVKEDEFKVKQCEFIEKMECMCCQQSGS